MKKWQREATSTILKISFDWLFSLFSNKERNSSIKLLERLSLEALDKKDYTEYIEITEKINKMR